MMRIGILTFHCAHNYGAVLQCYALQEFLKGVGHEVYVIDYRPSYLINRYSTFACRYWIGKDARKTMAKWLTEPYLFFIRKKRHRLLESFVENKLHLFPFSSNCDFFDVVILGSDQIWSPKLTGKKHDEVYFGKGFNSRKIAYAVSNRSISLNSDEIEFYKSHLKGLDFIGVRESTLQKLLQPISDKPIFLNIDPTLLSDKGWTDSLRLEKPVKGAYVLLYEVSRHPENRKVAMEYAGNNNSSFVELTGMLSLSYRHRKNLDQTASPEKFLSYLKYADCIFTTSFHGTSLSILFEKNFYYIKQNTSADIRIESLLEVLDLKERIIDKGIVPHKYKSIDYSLVREKLALFRKESVQYLVRALESQDERN